ncbi:MAG: CDP-alcohol phosphatidyltransferase family protein [Pyrinomonadaceae bacterium]|jgi:cardiolipin synthase|nr:CDP-alcohol phosphatidyltransferase family protein [Pyrinomonadaceae bacterium]MBA3572794.1 CDP-alcohol phosphatidyltransferase family protein [Pyrinomonadaceae bacterium]
MSSRIVTVPNMLTIFRMVLIPVFVTLVFYQRFLLALAAFVVAGITDGLDGLLARRFDQRSQLGTVLDPIADKLMLVTAFVVLSMRSVFPPPVPNHLPIPFWVTIAVISRDVFIVVGAAAINIMTGFRGFRPSWLGKVNTTVQIIAIAIIMFAASVPYGTGYYLPTLYAIVFALVLLSGAHYVFFASKLLNEDRNPSPEGPQKR